MVSQSISIDSEVTFATKFSRFVMGKTFLFQYLKRSFLNSFLLRYIVTCSNRIFHFILFVELTVLSLFLFKRYVVFCIFVLLELELEIPISRLLLDFVFLYFIRTVLNCPSNINPTYVI